MTINIFVLKGDLNGENRSGAFFFVGYRYFKIVSEYDQEIPQSQTADKHVV